MNEKEFSWKGLKFVWNGRRRLWFCERPDHQSADWWVTLHCFERSHMMKEGQSTNWDSPPDDFMPGTFASAGWMAHFGHGDAALRPTREEALDAALGYALRFHHQSIAALRQVCFMHQERFQEHGEWCPPSPRCGNTLSAPGATTLVCEQPAGHPPPCWSMVSYGGGGEGSAQPVIAGGGGGGRELPAPACGIGRCGHTVGHSGRHSWELP